LTLILVRYAELGLKSERVRRRFLQRLIRDISSGLEKAGIDHLMENERGRIFIECSDPHDASEVLRRTNGIHSFSVVEECGSRPEELMTCLAKFGSTRIRQGMTYGLKVKRTGSHPYTSQEIAAMGGGAVISQLPQGAASVDLTHPDVWVEVEIRENRAYVFSGRERGLGGMPSDTQGRVLLWLPGSPSEELRERALLSYWMMARRGCNVVPVAIEPQEWAFLSERIDRKVLAISDEMKLPETAMTLRADGIAYPFDLPGIPICRIHPRDRPLAEFYPTSGLSGTEVDSWLVRLS